jgi:hypothetical protein
MNTATMQHCQLKKTLLPATDTFNGLQNCIAGFHSSIQQSINPYPANVEDVVSY